MGHIEAKRQKFAKLIEVGVIGDIQKCEGGE